MGNGDRVLVTGGAGFIGSHLVDALMDRCCEVVVFDNLSSGSLDNVAKWLNNCNFKFVRGDLVNISDVREALGDCKVVFHFAANPEVRVSSVYPEFHFTQNVLATYNLLEALRRSEDVEVLIFTSTSTVYGEAETPTAEDYPLLKPISVYGASKLACEGFICAYAKSYGFKAIVYRLANIVGSRSRHGVIVDFVRKLRANPHELEILGDGTQKKSYLHVDDCVDAILLGLSKIDGSFEVFNVGSEDQVDVLRIAKIVAEEMGLDEIRFVITGGVDGGRGWVGDVKNMLLDICKLKRLGWKPKRHSADSVRLTVRELLSHIS